jgi:glutathione S-transferase
MPDFILWGLTASPYLLKMQAILDVSGQTWRRWPEQGPPLRALAMAARLRSARRRGAVQRFPALATGLDEYPAVPYYSPDGRRWFYDSTGLGLQLAADGTGRSLLPADPAAAFLCRYLDETFDEFGLYMVHHMRWIGSARTTRMGDFTATELGARRVPGLHRLVANRLYRRQVRRCPYLFSVAPPGFDAGVAPDRTPPARAGFPPTHALLERCWRDYLAAMESLLATQPFLLGERFTLADASAYGQLGMNLVDPEAADLLHSLSPRAFDWLCAIRDGAHRDSDGEVTVTPALEPLLSLAGETFAPLMAQNEAAYERALAAGETLFNEAAFDRDRALYDGELRGEPFRAVVKTFQVAVWRELKAVWSTLGAADRDAAAAAGLGPARALLEAR